MRLFIAFNLTESDQRAVFTATAPLRENRDHIKWTAPQLLHVTLKFLGDREERDVPTLADMVSRVAAEHPGEIPVELSQVGAFPALTRPRVVWMGMAERRAAPGAGDGQIARIADAIDAECGTLLGIAREERPFHPHVTLGRVKGELSYAARQMLTREAERIRLRHRTTVRSIDLMHSVLSSAGPRYSLVASAQLGGVHTSEAR